jgi:hypothetical protein
MGPLGITVSPNHLRKHIVIVITRTTEYSMRKENETRTRIVGIVIKVLNHEDNEFLPRVIISIAKQRD